ncbi:MAG: FecR domain-containing protein [Odoribacteraceae bacterium]|jgi:ferric-dicitrate binding protein FerR (iron transport regulator)|nr:FecR domain-containing protein [Odoribacteraceae bacterium]
MEREEEWTGWVIAHCKHAFSREEHAAWKAWMERSAANRALFHDAVRAYRRARRVAAWDRVDERTAWERLLRRVAALARRRKIARWGARAASVALLAGSIAAGYWYSSRQAGDSPPLSWPDLLPGETRAILRLADGQEMVMAPGTVVRDTTLGFRDLPDAVGLTYRGFPPPLPRDSAYHTLIVPRKGEYFLVLSDGSRAWLNADSELRYPVTFTGKERKVFLSGEAYFIVARDSARPFVVESAGARVEALGTRFNVAAYREEERVVTTLEEGRVRVRAGGEERVLVPGTRAVATAAGLQVLPANVPVETGWIYRVFEFVEMPLGDITRQLQRWYDVEFTYRDAGLQRIPFTGTVGRDLPLQHLLRVIEQLAEVEFTLRENKIEVTRK